MSLKPCLFGKRNQLFTFIERRADQEAYESEALSTLTEADDALSEAAETFRKAMQWFNTVRQDEITLKTALRITHREFCYVWGIHQLRLTAGAPRPFLLMPAHFEEASNEQLISTLLPFLGQVLGRKDLRPIERMSANQLFVELNRLRRGIPLKVQAYLDLDRARYEVNQAALHWDESFIALSETLDLERFFSEGSVGERVLDAFLDEGIVDLPISRPPTYRELRLAA